MSGVAKAGLSVVVGVPAVMVAALLFSPLVVPAGYGLDALIGQLTGCSLSTLGAAINGLSPLARVPALAVRELTIIAYMIASLLWGIGLVMMNWSGANEVVHNMGRKYAGYSTAALIALAVSIPIYSQGMCLAT